MSLYLVGRSFIFDAHGKLAHVGVRGPASKVHEVEFQPNDVGYCNKELCLIQSIE